MSPSFNSLRVLTLESRRAAEIGSLIATYGGHHVSAPAMREVPIESNTEALHFAEALVRGEYDVVVLLTGVGLRALLNVVDALGDRAAFITALGRSRLVARGPKPMAVLRELGLTAWVLAPEPNTWRELLAAIDAHGAGALSGVRVAVQEYGRSNPALIEGLVSRGARVTPVPVYQYALPEDVEPLRGAIREMIAGRIDVAMFTTGTQIVHLFQVADAMGEQAALRDALDRVVLASIGPTTSEELREQGLAPDIEPSHPKMGFLVREAAERSPELVRAKGHRPTA
jgi:uroporphyrinogen-III synthase